MHFQHPTPLTTPQDGRDAAATSSTKSITAVAVAYATGFGSGGPSFAAFTVDQAFLDRVTSLVELCASNRLTEARVTAYPDWGPGDVEKDLRLLDGELVVTPGGAFWYTDCPKHGDHDIESRSENITVVQALFDAAEDGETVFMSDDAEVREMYWSDQPAAPDSVDASMAAQ